MRKLCKYTAIVCVFVSSVIAILQVELVQNYVLDIVAKKFISKDAVIKLTEVSGLFPLNLKAKSFEIDSNEFSLYVKDLELTASKSFKSIKKISAAEVIYKDKTDAPLNIQELGSEIVMFLGQKVVKEVDASNIDLAGTKIDLIKIQRVPKSKTTKIVDIKIGDELIKLNVFIDKNVLRIGGMLKEFKTIIEYGFEDSNLYVGILYSEFGNLDFKGKLTQNTLNGTIVKGDILANISALFVMDSLDIKAEASIQNMYIDPIKIEGSYKISNNVLRVDKLSVGNWLKAEPFQMTDLKSTPIKIEAFGGTILGSSVDFSKDVASYGSWKIENIDLSKIKDLVGGGDIRGVLGGDAEFYGSAVKFKLDFKKVGIADVNLPETKLEGEYSAEILNFKILMNILKKQNIINGTIYLNNWAVDNDSKIDIKTHGRFALDQIFQQTGDQVFSGSINYDLKAVGSLGEPLVGGVINLTKAKYINKIVGAVIRDIQANVKIDKNIMNISGISATERNRHILSGGGKVFLKDNDIHSDIKLNITNLQGVDMKEFKGTLNGTITAIGDTNKGITIGGNLILNDPVVDISNIVSRATSGVGLLTTIDNVAKDSSSATSWLPINFNVTLDIKPNLSVIGYGILKSTWEGQFHANGPLQKLDYGGTLKMKKGAVNVSGKTYKLSNGEFSLVEGAVFVAVSLSKTVDEYKLLATFEQRDSETKVKLTSTPPLSEKDVLSLLLFDKKSTDISASEGFTLLSILNKGFSSSEFNILDKFKSMIGLDSLEMKQSDDGDEKSSSALSIGKKIGKTKISIDQGMGADSTKVVLEAKINKNLKAAVNMSSSEALSGGLFWSKRY